MTRNGKVFLVLYLLGIGTFAAVAANDTIGVTPGSGKTGNLIKFGSNNVISEVGVCDATTENQCAAVSAGGAVKTDSSATTQPVSAASLPLPTGASTAALQPTAAAQGSATSGQTGPLVQCSVTTAAPTYTTAQTDPLNCDTTGNLRVNIMAGPPGLAQGSTTSSQTGSMIMGAVTTAAPTNTTGQTAYASLATTGGLRIAGDGTKILVTPDSVALPANQSVNVAQFGGVSTSTGQVAVSVAPVTATNTALVTALRPDSPGIIALGPATAANSVPMTIGPTLLGSYCMGANTGTMAAGLAGGSPIFSFRYGAANLAIIRRVSMEADDITTAFVAGAGKMDMIAARSFTASDTAGTAGTLTGNNGKLRTSFATTGISDFRISSTATLTAGTRTLDAQPLASTEFSVSTSIDAQLLPTTDLFRNNVGESPLVLAQNEGFVVQATVPGTGTWVASVRVCWDEVSAF